MKSLVDVCIEVHLLIADLVERVMRLHVDANLLPSTVLLRALPDTFLTHQPPVLQAISADEFWRFQRKQVMVSLKRSMCYVAFISLAFKLSLPLRA